MDAVSGVEVGTELAWRYADDFKLPRFFVINKMDRDNADFDKTYAVLESLSVLKGSARSRSICQSGINMSSVGWWM